MTRQFKQRILISTLGIASLIICIYFSNTSFFKPIFIFLNAVIISLALKEYYHLSELKGFNPLSKPAIGSAVAYLFVLSLSLHQIHLDGLPTLILLFLFLFLFLLFFRHQTSALGNLAVTLFGFVYLVIPLSCILRINYFYSAYEAGDGRLWLAYVLIVSKMTDVGAYFCGKSLGKTKLAPMISPKKTIEGLLGGIGIALIVSILFSFQNMASLNITLWQSIWIGLLIGILAQLGDLGESLLKRDAGVKDSSHLPGLGGILDIVDSLVFTLPLMYLLLQMHVVG